MSQMPDGDGALWIWYRFAKGLVVGGKVEALHVRVICAHRGSALRLCMLCWQLVPITSFARFRGGQSI